MRFTLSLFVLLLFVAGCSAPDPFAEETQPAPAQGAQIVLNVGSGPATGQPAPVEAPAPSTVHFDVVVAKYSFTPSRLEVTQGDTVEITLTSADVEHGLRLAAFSIDEKVVSGETKTFSFVADKVGEFPFSCNVYCGSGHGDMDGLLVVRAYSS